MSVKDLAFSFTRAQVGVVFLISAMTGVAGAALGAKLAIDRLGEQLRQESDLALQKEIAETKTYIQKHDKQGDFSSPEEALIALHPEGVKESSSSTVLDGVIPGNIADALRSYKPASEVKVVENTVEVTQNVFTDAAYIREPFDYEEELKRRDPSKPYLVTDDEYNESDFHEKVDYTYYEGDGVLTNVRDQVIEDVTGLVGDNLMRFGDGSGDPNVVFVRNVDAGLDIEVTRSRGKYAIEVLGFDEDEINPEPELRHSSQRPRKFRKDD